MAVALQHRVLLLMAFKHTTERREPAPKKPENRGTGGNRIARTFGIALLALLITIALVLTSSPIRDLLVTASIDLANDRIAGELEVSGFEGSLLGRFTLSDLTLRHEGQEIVRVERASFSVVWRALIRGQLHLHELELLRPVVHGVRDEEAGWNLLDAVGSTPPDEEVAEEAGKDLVDLSLQIDDLSIVDGELNLTLGNVKEELIRLRELDFTTALFVAGADANAAGIKLKATLLASGLPPIYTRLGGQAGIAQGELSVAVESFEANGGSSQIRAQGEVTRGGEVHFAVEMAKLAYEDLEQILPEGVPALDYSGHFKLDGARDDAVFSGRLSTKVAGIQWQGALNLLDLDPAQMKGTFGFEATEIGRLLGREDISGRLAGTGLWSGSGGSGQLTLSHDGGALSLDFDLTRQKEQWGVAGLIESSGLDLSRILVTQPQLEGVLESSGRFSIADIRGETPLADAALSFSSSRLGGVAITSAELVVQANRESLLVQKMWINTSVGQIRSNGRIGLASSTAVDFEARVDVLDGAPLLRLIGQSGEGELYGQVKVVGDHRQIHALGNIRGSLLKISSARARDATLDLELSGPLLGPVTGNIRARVGDIEAEGFAGDAEVDLELDGDTKQGVTADFRLQDGAQQLHGLQLTGVWDQQQFQGSVNNFLVSALGSQWRLDEPTELSFAEDHLALGNAVIRSQAGTVKVGGRVSSAGSQRFSLSLEDVRLAPLLSLAGSDLEARAGLTTDVNVTGTAGAPKIDIRLDLNDLWVRDLSLGGIRVEGLYSDGVTRLTLGAGPPLAQELQSTFMLPSRISWDTVLEAKMTGPFRLDGVTRAIDIEKLAPFVSDLATELSGRVDAELSVTGTPDEFTPSFRVTLDDATVKPRATGVRVESITGVISYLGNELELESLTASAGEGRLAASASGRLSVGSVNSSVANVTLTRWPVIRSRPYSLTASGVLAIKQRRAGPIRVEGTVNINDGTFRPVLDFLVETPPARDPTITFEDEIPTSDAGTPVLKSATVVRKADRLTKWFKDAEVDVGVSAERNLWVQHKLASLELQGQVRLHKASAEPGTLHGRIRTRRGWFNVQGRRFKIVDGELTFVGGDKVDPVVDLTARHKVKNYTIDAIFSGPISSPSLALTSDPSLEQSDILAVLLFGGTVSELSGGERSSLGYEASAIAASYGITAAGRSVANAMRLEETGLQLEELSQDRLSIGAYVGRNTFVSVTQEFSEERTQQFSLEYEFWPGWSVVMSSTARGSNSADVVWKLRY